ncbi:MAG: hypothetical protein ACXWJN_03165 [Methyloceanibacter sp.]
MRRFALALMFSSLALAGALADESCQTQADAKKLAGAALNSFMKKCESEAQTACDKQAIWGRQRQLHQEVCQGRNRRLAGGLPVKVRYQKATHQIGMKREEVLS